MARLGQEDVTVTNKKDKLGLLKKFPMIEKELMELLVRTLPEEALVRLEEEAAKSSQAAKAKTAAPGENLKQRLDDQKRRLEKRAAGVLAAEKAKVAAAEDRIAELQSELEQLRAQLNGARRGNGKVQPILD